MQEHVLRGRAHRWARRGYDAIIGLGVATAALCVGLLLFGAGTVAVLAVAATCYLRTTRFPRRPNGKARRPWRR